ncbi:MAG: hydroxyacylglutathione hydrolase [Alphaproteobacteria bacterium]
MGQLIIDLIPALRDNYIYALHDAQNRVAAVIDPAEAQPVIDWLYSKNLTLTHVLNTHHHPDHVGGNLSLKSKTGCLIVGAVFDKDRIPGIDLFLEDNDSYDFDGHRATVLFIPGHTRGHIAYWFSQDQALFCGDTLFACGCGRLFEGTPTQMWSSLKRLRSLPGDTHVYCGHEYTEANIRFAETLDPKNPLLIQRRDRVQKLRTAGEPSLPSLLEEEKVTNPFLRCDDLEFATSLGLETKTPEEIFAEIRYRKDYF